MAKYIYPAIFTPKEHGKFSINFPDLNGCYTRGDNLSDRMEMAQDALALMITHLEDEKREIPAASSINAFTVNGEEFATYISCDTTVYRRLMNNAAVKKTLSNPSWLNDSTMAAGLNFSQVLQKALLSKIQS